MKILIKNVRSPFCFWGVREGIGSSPRFQALKREIDEYFGNDQLFKSVLTNPVEGMKCVVCYENKNWQRAVVEAVLVSPYGCKVRCFLVDVLEIKLVPSNLLFVSPPWVWEEPTQGVRFSLHGVTPTCLWTDYHKDQVEMRSHETRWDPSAIKYFKDLVYLGGSQGRADIISIDENEVHHVYLYISIPEANPISAADLLINKKFALPVSAACPVTTVSPIKKSPKLDFSDQSRQMNTSLEEIMKEVSSCLNYCSSSESDSMPSCKNSSDPLKPEERILNSSEIHNTSFNRRSQSLLKSELSVIQSSSAENSFTVTRESCAKNGTSAMHNGNENTKKSDSSLSNRVKGKTLTALLNETWNESDNVEHFLPIETEVASCNGSIDHNSDSAPRSHNGVSGSKLVPLSPELLTKLQKISSLTGGGNLSDEQLIKSKDEAKKTFLLIEKLLAEAKQVLEDEEGVEPVGNRVLTMTKENQNEIIRPELTAEIEQEIEEGNSKQPFRSPPKPKKSAESSFSVQQPPALSGREHCSILVKGSKPPNPYPLFCKTPFPSFITDLLESLRFRGPTQVQAYAWPSVMEHRNVVALAPSGGGKTLAYVAPLVAMLCQHRAIPRESGSNPFQAGLKSRKNPIVVVLCSSWKDVQGVTDCFKSLLHFSNSTQESHQVIGICGGPAVESKRAVELVAGCSILVTSPHTLIRICDAKYISLDRLEYLVLDNIHVLVEEFTEEIRKIMKLWSERLLDPDRSQAHRFKPKIFGFGIQWTAGIESFMDAYMTDPLLYINHPLEAAVYGKVHHEMHICNRQQSFDHLVELVQSVSSNRNGGVAIFVQSVSTMKKVKSALTCASIHSVGVEGSMVSAEMQEIQKQFEDESSTAPILIVTDDALQMLMIDSIEVSIHFELAKNKFLFGLRLGFMQYYYQIREENSKPCSHIFLTNENIGEVMGVTKFLRRLSQPIPPLLQQLTDKAAQSREVVKDGKGLCPFLKAFGNCRDSLSCLYRHYVTRHLDFPNTDSRYVKVPTSGYAKLKITCVANATHFHGHVIKCVDSNALGANQFDVVSRKMQDYFGSQGGKQLTALPRYGQVFAYRSSDGFYRANVRKPDGRQPPCAWKSPAGLTKLRIHLLDTGMSCTATLDSLYALPHTLAAYPYQAFEIRACGVKPIDKDLHWPVQANELVHDKIYNKTVEGKIVLALGHTVWLRPIFIRANLPITAVRVIDCDVIGELLQSGLAEKNPDHVRNLQKECSDILKRSNVAKASVDMKPSPPPLKPRSVKSTSSSSSCSTKSTDIPLTLHQGERRSAPTPPVESECPQPPPPSAENSSCEENHPPLNGLSDACSERVSSGEGHVSNISSKSSSVTSENRPKPVSCPSLAARIPSPEVSCLQKDLYPITIHDSDLEVDLGELRLGASAHGSSPSRCSEKSDPLESVDSDLPVDLGDIPMEAGPTLSAYAASDPAPDVRTKSDKGVAIGVKKSSSFNSAKSILSDSFRLVGNVSCEVGEAPPETTSFNELQIPKPVRSSSSEFSGRAEAVRSTNTSFSATSSCSLVSAPHNNPCEVTPLPTPCSENEIQIAEPTETGLSGLEDGCRSMQLDPTHSLALSRSRGFAPESTQPKLSDSPDYELQLPKLVISGSSSLEDYREPISLTETAPSVVSQSSNKSSTVDNSLKVRPVPITHPEDGFLETVKPVGSGSNSCSSGITSVYSADASSTTVSAGSQRRASEIGFANAKPDSPSTIPNFCKTKESNKEINEAPDSKTEENLRELDPETAEGLLHPSCVRLAHVTGTDERLRICQELYMNAREMPCDATERDLKSMKLTLRGARGIDELVLVLGSFLALATANVPLSDHLSLKDLVLIVENMQYDTNISTLSLALGKMIIQNAQQDLVNLVRDLVLCLRCGELDVRALTAALEFLDYSLSDMSSLLNDLADLDLAGLLMRLRPYKELEHVKRSIFVKVISHNAQKAMKTNEALSPSDATADAVAAKKKRKKRPVAKRVDCLNYARFDHIDTDTGSAASRPYTPVVTRFDTGSETETLHSETDAEQLLYGI